MLESHLSVRIQLAREGLPCLAYRHIPLGDRYHRCPMGGHCIAVLVARYREERLAFGYQRVSTRRALTDGSFCLDLSYLYSRLVQTYSKGSEELHFPEDSMPPSSSCTHEADEAASEPLLPQTRQSCELARHVEHSHLSTSVRHFLSMYVLELARLIIGNYISSLS